mgnify:CR=1 FL=1
MVEQLSAQTLVQAAPRGAGARLRQKRLKPLFVTIELLPEGRL